MIWSWYTLLRGRDGLPRIRKEIGDRHITSRMDWFLISESIVDLGSEIHCATLSGRGSDHWPIELRWSGLGSQFKKLFRFGQFWLVNPYFEGKIKSWWDEIRLDQIPNMFSFQQNLKALK